MASPSFLQHAQSAMTAHKAGNHTKAMHHVGHMMRSSLSAMKGTAPTAGAPAPAQPDPAAGPMGDSSGTPPSASPNLFFGQMAPKATKAPTGAPTGAPAAPAGVNKARFGQFKKGL